MAKVSELEEVLALQIRGVGLPEPKRQYRAIVGRQFAFDFAWPEERVLVEVNGGTWQHMGHSTGRGIQRDYEKMNLATLCDWRVLVFTAKDVLSGQAVYMIQQLLEKLT